MKRLWVISTVILFATGGTTAEITASLEVVAGQDVGGGPYRRAELKITNSAGAAVETVLLKPAGVGLTVRYKLTIPPGSNGKQLVSLPAISPTQEYTLTALGASGEVLGLTSASITWPAKLVTADAFIDDAFRAWTDDPARWSAKDRRDYLLVLGLFVVAAATTLFIRRPMLRVVAVVTLAAAVTGLIVLVLIPAKAETVQVHRYLLELYDSSGKMRPDSFAAVSTLRTTNQQSDKTWPLPYPVWSDRHAAANDDAVVNPVANTIRLTFRPGQVRIIRPDWILSRWRGTGPLVQPRHGTVRREANGLAVEANLIYGNALLIWNDSVWRIGSAAGVRKASVRTDQAESYAAFMSSEGGRKLNLHVRRLLNYWRNKHRQAGDIYLVEPGGSETSTSIVVVQLDEVSAW